MKQHRRIGWLKGCLFLAVATLVLQLLPDAARLWREWPRAGRQIPARATLIPKRRQVAALQVPETPHPSPLPRENPHPGPLPEGEGEMRYFVYLPREYSNGRRWPLLLFLHGSGQRGENLEDVLACGPAALIASGEHLPMIVVTPQCRADARWEPATLLALLDHVQQKFAVDPDRIYLAGYSMGAFGCWELALAAPERFAAMAPVAGGGEAAQAKRLAKLPIWAFHGGNDQVVPLESSQAMIEAIQRAGGQPRLTIYEERGHDTCAVTFSRADLYEWLSRQRRPVAELRGRD